MLLQKFALFAFLAVTTLSVYDVSVSAYTLDDVKNLTSELLTGYDKRHRPMLDQSQKITINVSLSLLVVQDVDAVVGKFSAVGTVVMIWTDQSLSWNTADHNGIASIVIPSSDIWNPTLVMANSYSRFSSLNADWTNTRVYSYGVVLSSPAAAFHSACTVNVKYYPYDKQTCDLVFQASIYFATELELLPLHDTVDMEWYIPSGEWDVESSRISSSNISTVSTFTISISLRRKPAFIVTNVILPIVFMAIINVLVFVIPPDSGERISYAVTMLLALAVFLTLVAEDLPKSSEPVPIVCSYLMSVLIQSVLMTCIIVLNLAVYHKEPSDTPPGWCRRVTNLVLCRKSRRSKTEPHDAMVISVSSAQGEPKFNGFVNKDGGDIGAKTEKRTLTWRDVSRAVDIVAISCFVITNIITNAYYLSLMQQGD